MIDQKERRYINHIKNKLGTSNITFFDVGGNRGYYTSIILSEFNSPTTHVFEPVPRLYNILDNKFGGFDNVTLNNFGCSDDVGSMSFYEIVAPGNEDAEGLSSFNYRPVYGRFNCNEIMVDTIVLDEYINENNITNVDFIKVDTEGHELQVLKGLKNSLDRNIIKYIQIEYGECIRERGNNLYDLVDLLVGTNYNIYNLVGGEFVLISVGNCETYINSPLDNFLISRYDI